MSGTKKKSVEMRIAMKRERLKKYYEAEERILNSQSYTLGTRTLTRANLKEVQTIIEKLESEIVQLERHGGTGRRVVRAVPVD